MDHYHSTHKGNRKISTAKSKKNQLKSSTAKLDENSDSTKNFQLNVGEYGIDNKNETDTIFQNSKSSLLKKKRNEGSSKLSHSSNKE